MATQNTNTKVAQMVETLTRMTVEINNHAGRNIEMESVGAKVLLDRKKRLITVDVNKPSEPSSMRDIGNGPLSRITAKYNNKNGKYSINFNLTEERLTAVTKAKIKAEVNALIEKIYQDFTPAA